MIKKSFQLRERTEKEIEVYMVEFGLTREEVLEVLDCSDRIMADLFDNTLFHPLLYSPFLKALRFVDIGLSILLGNTILLLIFGTEFKVVGWMCWSFTFVLWLLIRWIKNIRLEFEMYNYVQIVKKIMSEKEREIRIDDLYGRD